MNISEIPAWSEVESQPWFAELTPEEKQQSLTKWQGDMMQFARDPKEKFAVAATSKAKARSFLGEEMPDDPIADAIKRRQKDLEDIGSRYDAFSKGELEEPDEDVLALNDTIKGNTPYSVVGGRLFVSPSLVWDKAAYEKAVNEAPVDEDEKILTLESYDGAKERASESLVNTLGYTDEAFREFAAEGFGKGKSNTQIVEEWKAQNKLPDGLLGTVQGVGRQAYFGLRSGLSGLERAVGGLGAFFGSEDSQKYAEESGKESASYMARRLGEGPEFVGELASGATSIVPTIAAGAAMTLFTEGAGAPAAASIIAGALQSAGSAQADSYEFYREQGRSHADALAESRVDGLVSGVITGAVTKYAGILGSKLGIGKGIEGLFSGPVGQFASKITQKELSAALKEGAKTVGGSMLQEGFEEGADQLAQGMYERIQRDPTKTLPEIMAETLSAAKVGAVLGGAAEGAKLGISRALNRAKFAVPTTEDEEALRAKFEVPVAAEAEVEATPEVQQATEAIKTAVDVADEVAPVAPATSETLKAVAAETADETAGFVAGSAQNLTDEVVSLVGETTAVSETQPQQVETQENAPPEVPLQESFRQEPQDRVEVRTPEETGAGDSVQRAAEGEKEVAPALEAAPQLSSPTTGQVPTETLPDGQVTPGGVATPGVARDTTKPEQMTPEEFNKQWDELEDYAKKSERKGKLDPSQKDYVPVTKEEREALSRDWREFSRMRGYSASDIAKYAKWYKISGQEDQLLGAKNDTWRSPTNPNVRHKQHVDLAISESRSVSAAAVDAYGIKLPEGYVKQGELYVYEKTQPLPKGDAAGERGAVAPAPTVEPAPEARPVSQPVQSFRDAVSQMTPMAQAKWTPELRATAEAWLDSGGTTGLEGLSETQIKVVGRYLPEEAKAAFDAEDARKRAQRNRLPDHRESSLPPIPSKKTRKLKAKGMELAPAVLDELAKVLPNIRELVEVRDAQEGEPDAEGFYDPQTDKPVVLANNVFLKDHHAGNEAMALKETIVHELLHRGFAKLRQTNPQLFQQFEAFSITDTNDNLLDSLVRRGYTMYSNWRNDPVQAQKAREEVFVRKAALDLAVNGLDAIKSPTSLASQFFKWFKEFLSKLLGRTPPDNQLVHWTQVFLNAAQAEMGGTQGDRMLSVGRDLLSPEKYARHAELEAKHNAGTITPEETAEAQALVEEAAKRAGVILEAPTVGKSPILSASSYPDAKPFKFYQGFRYEPGKHPGFTYRKGAVKNLADRSIGFYLSGDREHAEEYSKKILKDDERIGETRSLYVKSENPFKFYVENLTGRQLIEALERGGVKIPDDVRDRWTWVYTNGLSHESKIWKWINADHMNRGEAFNDSLRNAFIAAGYDSIMHPDSSGILWGLPEPVMAIATFSPNQIKSADPFTGVPLEQRFGPSPDIRYSLADKDAEYLDAVEAGDMEKAQRMVDEAAKAAGYASVGYRASENTGLEPFPGNLAFAAKDEELAKWFGAPKRVFIREGVNPTKDGVLMSKFFEQYPVYAKGAKSGFETGRLPFWTGQWDLQKWLQDNNVDYDSLYFVENGAESSVAVKSLSQLKSADPVTYDDAGNVIPLSQRFQTTSPDIRYALGEPPDMQEVKDRLNTFIDENKATNSFLEAFGPVRVERMQQQGEKLGPAYIVAQVRPLMQRAQSELGFELDEEGNYVLSQRATDKAQSVLVKWLQDGRKFAKAYNKKAEKFYEKLFPGMEDIPVDSDMAAAVLLHEIMSYAKALAASSPKAEDQILLDMVRPQYGSVVLANYDLTMHKTGRTLQTARNYSEGTELGQDAVEKSNAEGEKKAKEEFGPEAISYSADEGKVGLEAGVDAAPDLPAGDPTLRLLDLAVESLDDVAKAKAESVFRKLALLGMAEEALERAKKVGNKAMSILTDPGLLAQELPSTVEELEALAAKLRTELTADLADLDAALQGAKPETRKKVKERAKKAPKSVQSLIDKLSKMPDEAKEAKPKAETLRSVLSDAIKAKDFDEKPIREAADKAGATPEQVERLVEEAKRLHEIGHDKTPSKSKLRSFLLSHPQETLYNPEQRQALVKAFLRNEVGMSEPEIARYLPKFEKNFVKAMEDARKKYLDDLETKFNAPKKERESRVDAKNRKLLNALRAGLAETKAPKTALLEKLGFQEFKPADKHVIAKLDVARTEALANGEFAKARLKQTELASLLLRRRPPMGWQQLFNQAWITSALSSFRNLALNIWTPLGEALSRYFGALAGALKTGDFTTVTALTKALGEAFRRVPARFKFAYSANTFTQQANAAIAEQASLIDEFRRSLAQLRDKKLNKKDRHKAFWRVFFSFGDYSRRLLQSIDETWFSILESFISAANLTADINKYGIKAQALTDNSVRFATQAKNDAFAADQIVNRLSDYLDSLKGKTTEQIQQALELYRMDQLGISPENLAFTNEMLDVIEQLRLRSGAEGDALLKSAKRNINDYRRLAWVRAAEKADADTREWVSALLTGKGATEKEVEKVLKDATEGAEKAASYGMGLHRVEEAPALDIGNTFAKMIEAMGQQAIRVSPLLGRMMVGFFGIPVNLMNKSLWYAPGYGLVRYYAFRKMAERHPEKDFYAYSLANEKERAQRFREVWFGQAVFVMLAALGAFQDREEEETEGLYVTLGGPANKTEKDAWLARGFRPYSIAYKFEDGSVTSIPYGVGAGEFLKMPLMAAGAIDDMRLNKKLGNREDMSSALEYFNAFAAGVGRQATFLGAKNTVGALLPDTFGAGTVANVAFAAGNFFPFNGLDRSLETLVSGPPDRSRTGAILANIPYFRHFDALGARPATNVFGDPWGSKTADPIEIMEDRFLSQSITVWNTSKPLTGQDKKLYEFIGRYQVGPNGPQRGALELRNGYLTDQEWANYREVWAANAKREWLSSLDRMRLMDDDGRAKAVAELSTKASRKAKSRFNYE